MSRDPEPEDAEMPIFLLDHLDGCTPLTPCRSCEAANFLKGKLNEQDFFKLVQIAKGYSPSARDELLEKSIDELQLSVRSYNSLRNDNIKTLGELVKKTEAEMLRTPNFGRRSLNEVKEVLAQIGLSLRGKNT